MKTTKLSSLLVLMSFLVYMPFSCLSASAAIDINNAKPNLNGSINGGFVGVDTNVNGGKIQGSDGKLYDNFQVNMGKDLGKYGVAQFDWNSFNVGKNVAVNFGFNGNSQVMINRVLQQGGMSQIYGRLMQTSLTGCSNCAASSRVILFNPAGVMFNNGSSVNLNSFTATTQDILGMKDIKDMTEADINNYGLKGVNGNYTADINSNFWQKFSFSGPADASSGIQFQSNNNKVKYDATKGNYYLSSDGNGEIAYIGADGSNIYADKFIGMVGNKIDIKNSELGTYRGNTPNYPSRPAAMKSNIRLVTSDGVNFVFDKSGDVNSNNFETDKSNTVKSGSGYGITIDNSNVKSGHVAIIDTVNNPNSGITIKNNSTIFATKLPDVTTGDIKINTDGTLNIANSQIQTLNAWDVNATYPITHVNEGGNIELAAGKDVNITNTKIYTSDSTATTEGSVNSGNINIISKNGNVTLKKDAGYTQGQDKNGNKYDYINILSAGNMNILAENGNIKTQGYGKIQAQGHVKSQGGGDYTDRNLYMKAKNIDIADGAVAAYNVSLVADNSINVNNAMLYAGSSMGQNQGILSMLSRNTTIDNSSLIYDYLNFYTDDMFANDILNNVTIKNGSTFFDRIAESGTTPFMILTNGNITIDNNALKSRDFIEETQKLADVTNDQKQILVQSLKGNVDIKNNSNIASSTGTIAIKAIDDLASHLPNNNGGSVSIADSSLNAKGLINIKAKNDVTFNKANVKAQTRDAKITTTEGKVAMANSNVESLGNDVIITQKSKGSNLNENYINSTVKAKNNTILTVNGSTSDITGSNINMFIAGNRKQLNADRDIILSDNTQNIAKADLTAGRDTSVSATTGDAVLDDVNFTSGNNSSISAKTNANVKSSKFNSGKNNTIIAAAAALTDTDLTAGTNTAITASTGKTELNNTTLNSGAENTVTSEGDVDINKVIINKGKTTIDSNSGSVKTINNQTINAKGNKLIVNAGKDVDLLLEGVGNKANGIEINSKFDTSTRDKQNSIKGKTVTVVAKDGTLAIAKIKAGKLNMDQNNTFLASTETGIITDKENTSLVPEEYKPMSYIEVADGAIGQVGQWNMDENVYESENLPPFYIENQHFDELGGDGSNDYAKHFIKFSDNDKFLLVYDRYAHCDDLDPVLPNPDPITPVYTAPDITGEIAKLPRHEEGVSRLAPIANYITDPMGNIIAAAASLTLDEDDEDDKY